MEETCHDVVGYEGLYQVSNLGSIKSLFRYKKQLKPMPTRNGYLHVQLFKNKIGKWFLIHRLVAIAFIPNLSNLPCVNHIDENKTNNCLKNLEWVSVQENNIYGTRLERMSKNLDYSKRKVNNANQIKAVSKPILQYSKNGDFIKEWSSASELCYVNKDFIISSVRRCCTGERKTAHGFIFKEKRGNDLLLKL